MEDILKKLEIARKNLEILENLSPSSVSSGGVLQKKEVAQKKQIKLQSAEQNLQNLAALSGTYEFQTLQIVGNTIPESWCPEVISTSSSSNLLSDLVVDTDPVSKLGLGNLSNQDSSDVNITGGKISLDGSFNTGVVLLSDSFSTGEISIRSSLIDFTSIGQINVFIVPTGYVFLINSMEIITLEVNLLEKEPTINFGNSTSTNEYYGPFICNSTTVGSRHICQVPQNGIEENTIITIGVTETSTADVHRGVGVISGFLLKLD